MNHIQCDTHHACGRMDIAKVPVMVPIRTGPTNACRKVVRMAKAVHGQERMRPRTLHKR